MGAEVAVQVAVIFTTAAQSKPVNTRVFGYW